MFEKIIDESDAEMQVLCARAYNQERAAVEKAEDDGFNEYENMSYEERVAALPKGGPTSDFDAMKKDITERLVLPVGHCTCTFSKLCSRHFYLTKGHSLNHDNMEQFKNVASTAIHANEYAIVAVTLLALELQSHAIYLLANMPFSALKPVSVDFEHIAAEMCFRGLGPHAMVFARTLDQMFMWYPDKKAKLGEEFFTRRVLSHNLHMLEVIGKKHLSIKEHLSWHRRVMKGAAEAIMNMAHDDVKWAWIGTLKVLKDEGTDFSECLANSLQTWFYLYDDDRVLCQLLGLFGMTGAQYKALLADATKKGYLHRVIKAFAKAKLERTYPHPLVMAMYGAFWWTREGRPIHQNVTDVFEKYGRYWVDTANLCAEIKSNNFTGGIEDCKHLLSIAATISRTEWPASKLGEQPPGDIESMVEAPYGPWKDLEVCAEEVDLVEHKRKRHAVVVNVSKRLRK